MPRTRLRARVALLVSSAVIIGTLSACTAGPNDAATVGATQLAGFWPGLWEGLISPIAFIVSLFNHDVGIYEIHNNGNWYNFGFMMGASIALAAPARSGCGAASARKARDKG